MLGKIQSVLKGYSTSYCLYDQSTVVHRLQSLRKKSEVKKTGFRRNTEVKIG